jgi:transposase
MEEVLTVYTQPYDPQRPVVCFDETSKQLIEEVRHPIVMEPGQPERYDTEYKRNGVVNIFMGFEPLAGKRLIEVTNRRTKADFAQYIKTLLDEHYPHVQTIVLVMDNLNTHTKASLYEAFPPEEAKRLADKLEIHYTPLHGSWLNMAEIELSHLSRQCLDRRIDSKEKLQSEATAWMNQRNQKQTKMDWRFTVEDARIKLKRLYPAYHAG